MFPSRDRQWSTIAEIWNEYKWMQENESHFETRSCKFPNMLWCILKSCSVLLLKRLSKPQLNNWGWGRRGERERERERERARRKGTFVTFLWHICNQYGTLVTRRGTLVTRCGTLVTRCGILVTRYGTLVTQYGTLVTNMAHW